MSCKMQLSQIWYMLMQLQFIYLSHNIFSGTIPDLLWVSLAASLVFCCVLVHSSYCHWSSSITADCGAGWHYILVRRRSRAWPQPVDWNTAQWASASWGVLHILPLTQCDFGVTLRHSHLLGPCTQSSLEHLLHCLGSIALCNTTYTPFCSSYQILVVICWQLCYRFSVWRWARTTCGDRCQNGARTW